MAKKKRRDLMADIARVYRLRGEHIPRSIDEVAAAERRMKQTRVDEVPPDGWITELRGIFGIDDSATWQDILGECAQTRRLADRVARDFVKGQAKDSSRVSR